MECPRGCKYWVNTNLVVDVLAGDAYAEARLRGWRGRVCMSELVIVEFRRAGAATRARNFAKRYGVAVAPVSAWLYERLLLGAFSVLLSEGVDPEEASENTILDTMHLLHARLCGAETFVTGDWSAANRALRLGLCSIYTRTRPWLERCPWGASQSRRCGDPSVSLYALRLRPTSSASGSKQRGSSRSGRSKRKSREKRRSRGSKRSSRERGRRKRRRDRRREASLAG